MARKPGIYKEDYITELYRKYCPGEDILPDPPMLPAWCTERDDEDEGSKNFLILITVYTSV